MSQNGGGVGCLLSIGVSRRGINRDSTTAPPPPSRIRYRPQFQAAPERGTGRKNDDLGAGGGEQQPNSAPLPPPAWMRSTRDGTASRTRLQSSLCFGGGRRRGWGGSQAPSVSPGLSPKSPTLLRHPRNAASGQAAVTPPPPLPSREEGWELGWGGGLSTATPCPPPRGSRAVQVKGLPLSIGVFQQTARFWVRLRLTSAPPPPGASQPRPPHWSRGWRRAKATAPKHARKGEENNNKKKPMKKLKRKREAPQSSLLGRSPPAADSRCSPTNACFSSFFLKKTTTKKGG